MERIVGFFADRPLWVFFLVWYLVSTAAFTALALAFGVAGSERWVGYLCASPVAGAFVVAASATGGILARRRII